MKKHIVCFDDSNTHGYCADPNDCADGGDRFNERERWTCLLQNRLGENFLVLEEGLSGRTTVFSDPLHESMPGLETIYPCLMSHEPVDHHAGHQQHQGTLRGERACHRHWYGETASQV